MDNVCGIRDLKTGQEYFWCYSEMHYSGVGNEEAAKVRIRIHYSYSDVQRYNALLSEWRE